VFVAWCVSGIVLMYYGIPHLTAGERLMRLTFRLPRAHAGNGGRVEQSQRDGLHHADA
jgi:hypothetical protein